MGFPPHQPNGWKVGRRMEIEDVWVRRAKCEKETTLPSRIKGKIILEGRIDDRY